jgi:penicillin-binding protein 1C
LAFDDGLAHPETMIEDAPVAFGSYRPQNFDKAFRGTIRLRQALQLSLNIPVVMLLDAIGPARLIAAMERAGVRPVIPGGQPGLAVALGGVGVTLADLVQLYAALAEGGRVVPLHVSGTPAPMGRIVSDVAAWQVGDILQGMPPPAGSPANRLAYKTGTSYGHRDAWAIGYDGRHVIGVWMGRPDGTPVPGAFGGDLAAPILFEAFARLKPKLDDLPPPPPAALIISTADLPLPLQHFRPRNAVFAAAPDAPVLAFPPDGAAVELAGGPLRVKVSAGTPPFTWMADGVPLVLKSRGREESLPLTGPGFVTLLVIDAEGRSAKASITLQ